MSEPAPPNTQDMQADARQIAALSHALDVFTESSRRMEEAYLALRERVAQLDQQLQEKNHQLEVTSDYLASLLESISDGVIAVDTNECITHFNRAACGILGFEASEVIGARFDDVFGRAFRLPLMAGQGALRARSGRQVMVNERDSTVAGSDGARLGQVKTFQDLSELHALREQVRQVDRLAAIGEMAASVAHEIRNPLGGIRGFTAFLLSDLPPEDSRRRMVEKIDIGARSLERVVNELLDYTRPVELHPRPVPVAGLVEAATAYLDVPEGVCLECTIDPGLRVWADADKLRQVLINVLLNGFQSLGGARGMVHAGATGDDERVVITIRDTGCGIAPEDMERIFSPFYTTKEKGTGLGLAVCAKIIEGHGGAITAESTPGEGTAIHIRLPRAE
jgi:PAS domain S-box-containing protein